MSRYLGMTIAVALCSSLPPFAAQAVARPLPVVSNFNVASIYGQYYEIASYPQWYSNSCTNTGIAFGPTNRRGTTSVLMSCDRGILHPRVPGFAVPLSKTIPARMWVDLKPPVGGAFQQEFDVIMAARDFSYFVIGHPSRQQLFILNRRPAMAYANINYIFSRLEAFYGYTNVRQHANCTAHSGYSNGNCQSARGTRNLFDDISFALANPDADDPQDATDEADITPPR